MSKHPKKALAVWTKSPVAVASLKFGTLETPQQLKARVKLAFMAGFDAGVKSEHRSPPKKTK